MTQDTQRKPGLALLASLLAPGLGQIYNGQLVKGLLIFIVLLLIMPHSPLATWVALHSTKHWILVVLLLFTGASLWLYIYNLRDAMRGAKQSGNQYTLKPINQSYVYIILFVLSGALYTGACIYTQKHLIQSVYVPSSSMLPNVMPGDHIFVDKRVHCLDCKNPLVHGDLAIFHDPKNNTILDIKRIIGMPGDKIDMKGKALFINSVPIRTIEVTQFNHDELDQLMDTHSAWREKDDKAVYTVIWKKGDQPKDTSYTVPPGHVFVLGDNRSASVDSRNYGMIPVSSIIGIGKQAWFSDSKTSGIRWWRVGHPVDALY